MSATLLNEYGMVWYTAARVAYVDERRPVGRRRPRRVFLQQLVAISTTACATHELLDQRPQVPRRLGGQRGHGVERHRQRAALV